MIISLVRSLPESQIDHEPNRGWLREKLGFVTDEHQINVALTRAKRGLCIIGKKIYIQWHPTTVFCKILFGEANVA